MQQSRGSLQLFHNQQLSRDRQQQQQTDVDTATKRQAAREVIDILHEISILLVCDLLFSFILPHIGACPPAQELKNQCGDDSLNQLSCGTNRTTQSSHSHLCKHIPSSLTMRHPAQHVTQLCTRHFVTPAWNAVEARLTRSLQNTHLDRKQLSLCVSLIENGVNPEALAVSSRSRFSSCRSSDFTAFTSLLLHQCLTLSLHCSSIARLCPSCLSSCFQSTLYFSCMTFLSYFSHKQNTSH